MLLLVDVWLTLATPLVQAVMNLKDAKSRVKVSDGYSEEFHVGVCASLRSSRIYTFTTLICDSLRQT